MGYFFDQTDLTDSLLLLALAIADHADAQGVCWNQDIPKLAKKIRREVRQTKTVLKRLEQLGHVEVQRGMGRGKLSRYQLRKVHSGAPFILEKVQSTAPFKPEKVRSTAPFKPEKVRSTAPFKPEKVQSEVVKGAIASAPPYKEPFKTKNKEGEGQGPPPPRSTN